MKKAILIFLGLMLLASTGMNAEVFAGLIILGLIFSPLIAMLIKGKKETGHWFW